MLRHQRLTTTRLQRAKQASAVCSNALALLLLAGTAASALATSAASAGTQSSGIHFASSRVREAAATQDDRGRRGFSIYDTQMARAQMDEAREHLAAERWIEGIAALQSLIDDRRGEVLGATRPTVIRQSRAGLGEHRSEQDVHLGAAREATRMLFDLAPEQQETYRERYDRAARRALSEAVATGDRRALSEVARRWPICTAAWHAYWALGDLEIEAGNGGDGLRAWARALSYYWGDPRLLVEGIAAWEQALARLEHEGAQSGGDGAGYGVARVAFAIALQKSQPLLGGSGDTSALRAGDGRGAALSTQPDSWAKSFSLPTTGPFYHARRRPPLYPTRLGDQVFLTDTLRTWAINAFTGEVMWESDRAPGWQTTSTSSPRTRTFRSPRLTDWSVDSGVNLLAPAAAQGVVVSAHMANISFEENFDFGQMQIIKKLPNRRLFAFDAATGEPLWNTMPPPLWDGEKGGFRERMRIIGAPTIVGSRVLVPAGRLRGRVEYRVGCYDLHSGELMWSTALVTGQRELNMFGRMEKEFAVPPLVVTGNSVIALTQLGTVAALDLFTGEVEWEVLYEQTKIPQNQGYNMQNMRTVWDNSPPVIAGETVIATPYDSFDLIAIDLKSGALIWSLAHGSLLTLGQKGSRDKLSLLVGAAGDTLYLAGNRVVSLRCDIDLSKGPPKYLNWVFPAGAHSGLDNVTSRPVLDKDRIYVPDHSQLHVVDRISGRLTGAIPWAGGSPGNLLLADGMMFSLASRHLQGYFDWEELIERSRREHQREPRNVETALKLATLLHNRGTSEWTAGDQAAAHRHIEDARRVLDSFNDEESSDPHPAMARPLHAVLRSEARVLADLARRREALSRLLRARKLATTDQELEYTLFEELELQRGFNERAWSETLEVLNARCGHLGVLCEMPESDEDQTGRKWAELLRPAPQGPLDEDAEHFELPVALWVLLQRIESAERSEGLRDFQDLHDILREYPGIVLPGTLAGTWAEGEIGRRLESGRDQGYGTFRERAEKLLERGLQDEDVAVLESLPRLYPHSPAAHRANDTRLDWAVESGDIEGVASIVLGELPDNWRPQEASNREVQNLLRLARAVGRNGNDSFEYSLVKRLAQFHPRVRSELPGDGNRSLRELAHALPKKPKHTRPVGTFTHESMIKAKILGGVTPLGRIPAGPGDTGEVHVFVQEQTVMAFSDADVTTALWESAISTREDPLNWTRRFKGSPGRALLATTERVLSFSRANGLLEWSWSANEGYLESILYSDGVVVAVVDVTEGRPSQYRVVGIDAVSGTELWRLLVSSDTYELRPVCGEGYAVFLPSNSVQAQVRDLFTGSLVSTFKVDAISSSTAHHSWIQDGRLILPRFSKSQRPAYNHVHAIELSTGTDAWTLSLNNEVRNDRELYSVVRWRDKVFLILQLRSRYPDGGSYGIYEVSMGLPALSASPIATFEEGVGLVRSSTLVLDEPYIFTQREHSDGLSYVLGAIHLPYGAHWESVLPFTMKQSIGSMPLPAISDSTVVLAWRLMKADRVTSWETHLGFFDRRTGKKLEVRRLVINQDSNQGVRFVTLGDGLYVSGLNLMEILR